ncbi:hypothetical protein MKX40_22155 [Paenibacillus sp. FSL R5-0517]|uniref:hypothetical protein n=1 Tax=Paenibacillus sp. FSL R5-0517 TaxID=2921647 RepID=UPI0030DAEFBA
MNIRDNDVVYLKKFLELSLDKGQITPEKYKKIIEQVNNIYEQRKELEKNKINLDAKLIIDTSKHMDLFVKKLKEIESETDNEKKSNNRHSYA